ncbi:MAG: DUF84 family protein [Myxococcota bacterium]
MKVRLGSANRAKLEALQRGLRPFFEDLDIEGVTVASPVSAQPLGFEEIVMGATGRARLAYAKEGCDLAAGIEDGLVPIPGAVTGYVNVGCCCLFDGKDSHVGFSAGFEYPQSCVDAAIGESRVPVGESFDRLFSSPPGQTDPGPGAGNIGRLTGGVLSRAEYSSQAVICAAVRLLHPGLYRNGS